MRAETLVLLSSLALTPVTMAQQFQGLGTLPGRPGSWSDTHISGDGSTVVGHSGSGAGTRAFRWTQAGGMEDLGVVGNWVASRALGVNYDGSVIVGDVYNGMTYPLTRRGEGYRWTAAGGMQTISDSSYLYSTVDLVTADGQMVQGWSNSGSLPVARWRWTQAGGVTPFGPVSVSPTHRAMNADGSVVVGGDQYAFRWTEVGGYESLGFVPGASSSEAWDTNPDGSVVVGSSGGGAFRWTSSGGMLALPTPFAGGASLAKGVSASGDVIVGFWYVNDLYHAVLWNAGEFVDLTDYLTSRGVNLAGWNLMEATDVSDDGRTITGVGTHNGAFEAWVVTIPAPGATTGLGIMWLLCRRRRTR